MKNDKNNITFPTSNMEPDLGNELLGTKKIKRLDTQCSIHVHSCRHRLTDPDGISAKAVIDGIVHAGLFKDDSAKCLESITFSQEKVKSTEAEKTIIYINRIK